jgi:hypothetical protein
MVFAPLDCAKRVCVAALVFQQFLEEVWFLLLSQPDAQS